MNEIFLRRPYTEGKQLEDYYRFTEKVARALEATIREEDPSRYTMMLIIICLNITKTPISTEIPMIQGWNLYQAGMNRILMSFNVVLIVLIRYTKEKY